MPFLVVDNGGGSVRLGWPTASPAIMPNQVTRAKNDRRQYIGDQIEQCPNPSSLFFRRPFDKGYLVNWDVQTQLWNHAFAASGIDPPSPTCDGLVLTEPVLSLPNLRHDTYQAVFEEHGFSSLFSATGSYYASLYFKNVLAPQGDASLRDLAHSSAHVVVDTGYSFTHAIPFFDNQILNYATKRIDVGGKVLTNYLKELVSYRHWNMMDESYVINNVKERVCYVAANFVQELQVAQARPSPLCLQYVLPDFVRSRTGYVRGSGPSGEGGEEQVLPMNNERFSVPELLFRPSDVGIAQAGMPEAVVQAINETPSDLREALYAHVILVGGNARLPGMHARLCAELRALAPDSCRLSVHTCDEPDLAAWRGAAWLAQQQAFPKMVVTKKEYEEYGDNIFKRKFLNT